MKTILKTNIMKSRHYDVKEITLVKIVDMMEDHY